MHYNFQNYYPYYNLHHPFIPLQFNTPMEGICYHAHSRQTPQTESQITSSGLGTTTSFTQGKEKPIGQQEGKAQGKQGTDHQQQNKLQQQQKGKEQQMEKQINSRALIIFDKLSAGSISNSSGIFNGKNIQFGWSSHSKRNTGFGTVGGYNNIVDKNTNVVFDNDQIDTPIDDRDTMWSPMPAP